MGKLILCTGKIGREGYCLPLTNIKVYSIEELCYYIYTNIYSITEDLFKEPLAKWISKELSMEETAEKLWGMIKEKKSQKDMIVTILCSADYYEEKEIRELIQVMDKLEKMEPLEREKQRGDNFLRYKDFRNAKRVYEEILNQEENKLSDSIIGNVLHNLGVAKIHCSSYEDAAKTFQTAYEKNQNESSLMASLMALYLGKKDEKYKEKMDCFAVEQEMAATISGQIEITMIEAEALKEYQNIEKIKKLKESGQMEEYYDRIDSTMFRWKEEYKNELL